MPGVAANHASFPRSSAIRQSVPLVTALLWLVLFAATLIFSVTLCDGRLIFTLDDPYIHLAVADHIRSGGYGVNASEVSSPSSSIIWPYLLAVTESIKPGPVMATQARLNRLSSRKIAGRGRLVPVARQPQGCMKSDGGGWNRTASRCPDATFAGRSVGGSDNG
ncbi:hypothetical protein [Bradyrhizobium elkanii]